MGTKIRVAVLGMGNMGRAHASNLLKMQDVELVALCSKPIDDAKKYVDENRLILNTYDDFYKMLESETFDVLYVCLPPFGHDGQIEAAAKKGIHIFVEKPIALSVERGRSMVDAVREHKVFSQVGYHMRFGAAVKRFKELVDSGVAGKPLLYTANYECNSLHTPWWIDVAKCGGQVFEQVIHLYDMALYIMGEPSSVNGYIANLNHKDVAGYTVEDTSVASIRFRNGSLGSITGSNCAIPNRWEGFFKVTCQNVVADFRDFNHAKFIFTKENNRIEEVSVDANAGYDEDEYFMAVIRGEKPEFASITEGFTGLRMVAGVVESSAKNGHVIEL